MHSDTLTETDDRADLGAASLLTRGPFGAFIEPSGMTMTPAIAEG